MRVESVDQIRRDTAIKEIDAISDSFCLAKWLQVTIDLERGIKHSCHHNPRHIIPHNDLLKGPHSLHNTPVDLSERRSMLNGEKPEGCNYCWKAEASGDQYASDRYRKSSDDWAIEHLEYIKNNALSDKVSPSYLEVMFGSQCNLSCCYCVADVSSSIMQEMKKYGPYDVKDYFHRMPYFSKKPYTEEENPYVKKFWQWLPEILERLRVIRVTGGEPFLNANTFRLMEKVRDIGAPKLTFAVNTNMCIPQGFLNRFYGNLNLMLEAESIKNFELYVSIDGYGDQAEYMRSGLSFETLKRNVVSFLEKFPEVSVVIMCTFNILSATSIKKLFEWVISLKRVNPLVKLDISNLNNPSYLSPENLNDELLVYLEEAYVYMKDHTSDEIVSSFSTHECKKFERVINIIKKSKEENFVSTRRDFIRFIEEYDRRKNTDFFKVFPEYKSFVESIL